MKVKPGTTYEGKTIGEFTLNRIANVNGKPVFHISTPQHDGFTLTLEEMREESPKVIQ